MMKPNSILGSYLIKQTILNFLFVLGVICAIIMMFDMIEILRRTSGRHDASVGFLLQYVIAKLPETVDKVVPFIVMVSTMIAFWRLSKSNEFVIIRATGVSIWGVLSPVLLAVFGIGVFWVAVLNPISAKYWADLSSNPHGGDLKYFNGEKWVLVNDKATTDISQLEQDVEALETALATKVDKVDGKGLSTNDFTNEYKTKVDGFSNYDDTEVRSLISGLNSTKADKTSVEEITPIACTAVSPDSAIDLSGKSSSELQANVTVNANNIVSGTINYVTGYTGFSTETSQQSGNYLALQFTAADDVELYGEVTGTGNSEPSKLGENGILVVRLSSNTQMIKIYAFEGNKSTIIIYRLTGLTLTPQS